MLLGLVTDIHEDIENLARVLAEFRRRDVELVVNLGDACDTYSESGRSREVVALLQEAKAVGVWGNHDVALCSRSHGMEVNADILRDSAPEVLEYMGQMQGQLAIENCRFSHVEPWLNPRSIEDLWYFGGPPNSIEKAARSFQAVPERVMFIGHFHRWLAVSATSVVDWRGESPLELDPEERYLIVVGPAFSGWGAVFDTQRSVLTPIRCIEV